MIWKIRLYNKLNGSVPVLKYILCLPPKHRAKILSDIDTIPLYYYMHFLKKVIVPQKKSSKLQKTG
jgi:hypothetical protein